MIWGEVINGEKCYPLHEGQSSILASNKRFIGAIAGTGGGKTAIGPLWILKQLARILSDTKRNFKTDPIVGMVVAPTNPIKERATAPTLVSMLKGTTFEGVYVPSMLRYTLPNDLGIIWVLSADNPDGLEGGQFDFIWADEAGQFKYDAMIAIEGRTGLKQAPVLLTSTPYGMNWMKYKFYDRYLNGDPQYFCAKWSSIKNPAYPKDEYERAKKSMSPGRAAQRYDAEFARMSGLVYPDIMRCKAPSLLVQSKLKEPGRRYGGLDFGWNDPFVGLAGHLTADNHLWLFYERYKRLTPIGEHAAKLPFNITYYADPSRPDQMRELRVAGHTIRKATNDILIGIDAVNARIYNETIHISEACTALWAETEEYRYPEKDDEVQGDKPTGGFDHACDALRYLIVGIDKRQMSEEYNNANNP